LFHDIKSGKSKEFHWAGIPFPKVLESPFSNISTLFIEDDREALLPFASVAIRFSAVLYLSIAEASS